MKILLALVVARTSVRGCLGDLLSSYEQRSNRLVPCSHRTFPNEAALLDFVQASAGRTRPLLWVADSSGEQITSDALAENLGQALESGVQLLILAIGPADGWSRAALDRAGRTLGFGRITLPHELAAVIAAEQIYRALTIRAGHPYHSGH